ncbi:ribonuclease VapC [Knoellia remsis]|uniref:Ribonuclease VapC n=1 Tax=Knoellia remsis TaxID=407159 RepID=A0A2T0UTN3_9MICO|nr:type II toxin-antitoxin system VapC family toxin [Knoellia remsis]PRY61286.1 ribonuclease VapC [Knoellia remsis]
MIVDTSAIIAILRQEPEADTFSHLLNDSPAVRIAAPTALETYLVAGPTRSVDVEEVLGLGIEVVAFTEEHLAVAHHAHMTYGRGSGSPARLNYGDCFSYALAKVTGEPLLFKGDDFVHTDIQSATGT